MTGGMTESKHRVDTTGNTHFPLFDFGHMVHGPPSYGSALLGLFLKFTQEFSVKTNICQNIMSCPALNPLTSYTGNIQTVPCKDWTCCQAVPFKIYTYTFILSAYGASP